MITLNESEINQLLMWNRSILARNTYFLMKYLQIYIYIF